MNDTKKLRDELKSISMVFSTLKTPYKPGKNEIDALLHILSKVKDHRMEGKIRYRIENILGICFYLALKGEFRSFLYAAQYVEVRQEEFIALGLIEKGEVPSHDTFLNIFNRLDASSLRDAFIDRFRAFLKNAYAIATADDEKKAEYRMLSGDGKAFNGSGRTTREETKRNINVFNIYSASNSICYTSVPLDDKDSEIPAFREILRKYDLRKTVVTADALHCQRATCDVIISKKGHYVIKAKRNIGNAFNEIEASFDKFKTKIKKLSFHDCDYEMVQIKDIISDEAWPGCRSYIKMVSHKRKDQMDYNPAPQYFISSLVDLELIAEAADNRWDIEDGLHLFKDSFLKEDECTFTGKNAIRVMATINNIVYAFYRVASAINGDDTMQKTIIRYKDDPVKLISLVVPLLKKTNFNALIRQNMRGVKKA